MVARKLDTAQILITACGDWDCICNSSAEEGKGAVAVVIAMAVAGRASHPPCYVPALEVVVLAVILDRFDVV